VSLDFADPDAKQQWFCSIHKPNSPTPDIFGALALSDLFIVMFCAVSLLYQRVEHAQSRAALLRAMARAVDRGLQTGAVE